MGFNCFDVSAKELVWDDPTGWLEWFGLHPHGPVEIIDTDITTLSAAADKVIRVGDPQPYLVNIELQSSHETNLPRTLGYRQAALEYRHDLPLLTILGLLRKEPNSPNLTGVFERNLPGGRLTSRYHYQVVKLWNEPVESFLTAGVDLVPLAPLADIAESELRGVALRMADRINREPKPRADKLWAATFILMGLRYPDEISRQVLEGVQTMRESTTYQSILKEGREEGEVLASRRILIRQGTSRFGKPDAATRSTLEMIRDVQRLEELADWVHKPEVVDWETLLRDE